MMYNRSVQDKRTSKYYSHSYSVYFLTIHLLFIRTTVLVAPTHHIGRESHRFRAFTRTQDRKPNVRYPVLVAYIDARRSRPRSRNETRRNFKFALAFSPSSSKPSR